MWGVAKTLWGTARRAAQRLKVRVSGDWNITILVDDVRFLPTKTVKGHHTSVRQHHTRKFINVDQQRAVAATLATETTSANLNAKLVSTRTPLNHDGWTLLFQTPLESLPVRGRPELTSSIKTCRRCLIKVETRRHVLNNCKINCQLDQSYTGINPKIWAIFRRKPGRTSSKAARPIVNS